MNLFASQGITDSPQESRLIRWPEDSVVTCEFSANGLYRYALSEIWDHNKPLLMWLMMNPSMGYSLMADPTLMKVSRFARMWGFGGNLIANLYALRTPHPWKLLEAQDPIGPDNDYWIAQAASKASKIMLAYGRIPEQFAPRAHAVRRALHECKKQLYVLRLGNTGDPWHPLYVPFDQQPKKWIPLVD